MIPLPDLDDSYHYWRHTTYQKWSQTYQCRPSSHSNLTFSLYIQPKLSIVNVNKISTHTLVTDTHYHHAHDRMCNYKNIIFSPSKRLLPLQKQTSKHCVLWRYRVSEDNFFFFKIITIKKKITNYISKFILTPLRDSIPFNNFIRHTMRFFVVCYQLQPSTCYQKISSAKTISQNHLCSLLIYI